MYRSLLLVCGIVACGLAAASLNSPVYSQDYEVTITNGQFSTMDLTVHYDDDKVTFKNLDNITRTVVVERDGFNDKTDALDAANSGGDVDYSPNFTDMHIGEWTYRLTGSEVKGVLTVVGDVATATATPSLTAMPTVTPTPTDSPTQIPSLTATPTGIATTMPTVSATATPTVNPTATAEITETPAPSPTVTVLPTVTPSPSLTPAPTATIIATPSASSTPTVSGTPSASPSTTPTATAFPTNSSSPSPSNSPVTPLPNMLPSFSIFRSVTCSSQVVGTQVMTDRLSPSTLIRGYWTIKELNQIPSGLSVKVDLEAVRVVNLLFRGSSFFNANKLLTNVESEAQFEGQSLDIVLGKASSAWCSTAQSYR